jgi:peptidoglycan glycosyltransferase
VNRPIARLFALVLLMFGALVAYTSRWTVFDASALQSNPLNKRTLLESQSIPRGSIYAANGALLAYSQRQSDGDYVRRYPFGSLFGQPIGFSIPVKGSAAGLEAYRNNALTGTPLEHQSLIDQLEGHQNGGDAVYTTLDPTAQELATRELKATHLDGAVVAIVPSTGAIKVFASDPGYDPNVTVATGQSGGSQFDQAAEGAPGEPPGSAQKVVTAIAAIDSGKFTPTSVVNGNSPQTFQGIPLNNDLDTSYGPVDLTDALTNSINTAWANVAQDLGPAVLQKYMLRLGYYRDPPIDLPRDELSPSGVRDNTGRLVLPENGVDYPLVGIGEGQLYVTPLQMAMVAAAVANHGVLMTPHITDRIVNSDGEIDTIQPTVYSTVMKPSTAAAVTLMMEQVVKDGTAEHALQGFPIVVAGKTGTAELSNAPNSPNDAWFIAFAPYRDIAVAVVVDHTIQYGADAAAPIARDVIQSLVGSG